MNYDLLSLINPESIVTEGKLDTDMLDDPTMILVDLYNSALLEAEEDLFYGNEDTLLDIVMMS